LRVMLALTVLTFLVVPGAASAGQTTETQESKVTDRCTGTKPYLIEKRQATWGWQDSSYVQRTKSAHREILTRGCSYHKWIAHLWAVRADGAFRFYVSLREPKDAICHVFGSYCDEALEVADCESHLSEWAENGQYLGMFQMGSSERRIYGHSNEPLGQARAAYAYFVATGRDWSPWSCKPY
jgi:hypothetical protein